jgi:hypothetical protein
MVDGNLVAICENSFEIEDSHLYQLLTTLPYCLLRYWNFVQIYGKFIKRILSHCATQKISKRVFVTIFQKKNHHNEENSVKNIPCPRVRALSK